MINTWSRLDSEPRTYPVSETSGSHTDNREPDGTATSLITPDSLETSLYSPDDATRQLEKAVDISTHLPDY